MSVLTSKAFWAATAERAIKTLAQGMLLVLGVAGVTPADVDWKQVLLGGLFGALLSVLSSVVSSGVGNAGPSLSAEVLTPPAAPVQADDPRL